MTIAEELHAALKAQGLEIHGIVIGPDDDKDAWRVIWAGEPSEADIAKAEAVIDAFDTAAAAEREAAAKALRASDKRMARLVEDLYDALIARGALSDDDLPDAALAVIAERKASRSKMNG